ncbi:RHS repeat-associated core domain-containing protein, partial [Abyssisolibacter fermentans]|uniref:RHS repeat-associated core domain-containing protein n=1 Tax=Abyssisolibacter fermentans TaxID=1766203 RepID=UPI0023DD73BF
MYNKEGEEVLKKSVEYIYDANGNEIRQKSDYIHPHDMTMIQSTKGNTHGKGITEEISTLIEREEEYYDGFNRLVKVDKITSGTRNIVTYRYNGDGQRTTKQEQCSKDGYVTKTTNYYYDRQHVILETGTETVSYVRGINYISRKSSIGSSYYFYNGHGDVVQTVSENGEVRNQYDYDIFGNPLLTIEEEKNEIRYSGEYYDESTGLYYLRARYYNPYTGRFISEDSYWGEDSNPLSLNLYTYCYNDPLRFIDPSGHRVMACESGGDTSKAIDKIVEELDKCKKKWNKENESRTYEERLKGKSTWTKAQHKAHDRANSLREQLAKLDTENKEMVKELVEREGRAEGYEGQYEKYQAKRHLDKISRKSKKIQNRQNEQYKELNQTFFGYKGKAKEFLKELQNMDKVTKEEYNKLIKLNKMIEYAEQKGRNVFEEEVEVREEDYKKKYRDGTEYDERDLILNQLNGKYWETYLYTNTLKCISSETEYEGIPLYRGFSNGEVYWDELYNAPEWKDTTLPEYINLTGGMRYIMLHHQTKQEKQELMAQAVGLTFTA